MAVVEVAAAPRVVCGPGYDTQFDKIQMVLVVLVRVQVLVAVFSKIIFASHVVWVALVLQY
jgi:hypothetical protein